MNPARSLAPALIMGGTPLCQAWLFVFAPLLGAVLSVFLYKIFTCKKEEKPKEKGEELIEMGTKE